MSATMVQPTAANALLDGNSIVRVRDLNVYYGNFHAVGNVSFDVPKNKITALIGPSGCGKSTVLRCINRMNDLVRPPASRARSTTTTPTSMPPASTRSRFAATSAWFSRSRTRSPRSICENIAWGAKDQRHQGQHGRDGRERCLRQAALWDEVKDKLERERVWRCPGASSSGSASHARWPSIRR